MTYTPTPEDVKRSSRIWTGSKSIRPLDVVGGRIWEILRDHHLSLAERGVFVAEWRPIEEAPKDGTQVLLYIKAPVKTVALSSWIGSPHNYWRDQFGYNFTHWMPLPPEPKP